MQAKANLLVSENGTFQFFFRTTYTKFQIIGKLVLQYKLNERHSYIFNEVMPIEILNFKFFSEHCIVNKEIFFGVGQAYTLSIILILLET